MTYYQITSEERYTIAALRREGFCSAEIARRLGRHRSTISREVRRNSSPSDGCYRPSKAIERTNGRRSRSRRNQYFTKADFALVEKKLKADWSPEQISGHLAPSRRALDQPRDDLHPRLAGQGGRRTSIPPTFDARPNLDASATTATTAEAAWPGSVTSPSGRLVSTSAVPLATGRLTPW